MNRTPCIVLILTSSLQRRENWRAFSYYTLLRRLATRMKAIKPNQKRDISFCLDLCMRIIRSLWCSYYETDAKKDSSSPWYDSRSIFRTELDNALSVQRVGKCCKGCKQKCLSVIRWITAFTVSCPQALQWALQRVFLRGAWEPRRVERSWGSQQPERPWHCSLKLVLI